jgi:cysteine desulfurase
VSAYLDHAATSQLRPEAKQAMEPHLGNALFGNPTGSHGPARKAREVIDDAREVVAKAFSADPADVVFTSGGTEANNLAVSGSANRGRVLCSAIEHHAVLEPVERLGGSTFPVTSNGVADVDALAAMLDESVGLVSAMLANNETGVIQPLHKVARAVEHSSSNALVHTDAVQATPWLDVASMTKLADLVTLSAHKFGGPMGIGALIVRNDVKLDPLLLGGGQERERRSGTHNVAGIAGMAAALDATVAERELQAKRVGALRDRIIENVGGRLTAAEAQRLPNIAHICFDGVENEALLILLDEGGVFASGGASCSSGALEKSHVLAAMDIDDQLAQGAVRFSLGWSTTDAEVDHAIEVVTSSVARLRGEQ